MTRAHAAFLVSTALCWLVALTGSCSPNATPPPVERPTPSTPSDAGSEESATSPARVAIARADALEAEARLDEARRMLEPFAASTEASPEVHARLGRIVRQLEGGEAALPHFEAYLRAPSVDPEEDRMARLEYARALRADRRFEESSDVLAALLEDDPTDAALYSELASTLYRRGQRASAQALEAIYRSLSQRDFEEHVAERLSGTGLEAQAVAQRAINLESRKRLVDAYRAYESALAFASPDSRIPQYFADFCRRIARPRDGLVALDAALGRGATPASGLWFWKSVLESELDRTDAALASLERARSVLQVEGEQGGVAKGQAAADEIAGVETGLRELASRQTSASTDAAAERDRLERELDRVPFGDSGATYRQLGELAITLRDPRALDFFLLASDLDPRDVHSARRLVEGLSQDRFAFVRRRFLRRILAVEPDDVGSLLTIAMLSAQLGIQLGEAETFARRALELAPGPMTYGTLARVLSARGEAASAREVLAEGRQRHPDDATLAELEAALAR